MGNQQERSLAWLAGIVDGEGSISFQVYTLPDGRVRITPFITVVNSDQGILKESYRILLEIAGEAGVTLPRYCGPMKGGPASFESRKVCRTIRSDGKSVVPILEALLPYLVSTKRRNAQVILKYLTARDRRLLKRDKMGRIERQGYTRSEIAMVCSIRTHAAAKSSEAICRAPNVLG